MLTKILIYLGVHPDAVQPAVQAFVRSAWVTFASLVGTFIALAYAQGALSSPQAFLTWAQASWWAFLIGQLIAPLIRGKLAVNQVMADKAPPS